VKTLRASAFVLTATLALAGFSASQTQSSSFALVWSDEFSGKQGTPPDSRFWNYDLGNREASGWGNHEFQYYTNSTDNARMDGFGNLEIRALKNTRQSSPCWNGSNCPYTSARITTLGKIKFTYGKIEARIKVPSGVGMWPAFWSLGEGQWPNGGEIDFMEWIGREPKTVYGTLHGPGYSGAKGIGGSRNLTAEVSSEFHTYTVIKRPNEVIWLMDGEQYHRVTPESLPKDAQWVFERSFHVLLNLAVGGDWPGPPAKDLVFPKVMKVDYVRIWDEK
jgi:beta-glucanase (GH16 family)